MEIEHTAIRDLRLYANNARTHSKKQLRQIAKSIERFGFCNPVLVDDAKQIIAGHGRVCAARRSQDDHLLGGLRQRAMVAPFVLEGAMNGRMFLARVKQCLVPTLKRGKTVFMDNLPVHKVAGVEEAIEAVGASSIYLPAYSPDLNPIELAFSVSGVFTPPFAMCAERGCSWSLKLGRRIGLCLRLTIRLSRSAVSAGWR